MPRQGDGLYKRGRTWWLDFRHKGRRYTIRIGSNVSRTVAREIAGVRRAELLKSDAGLITTTHTHLSFSKAATEFLRWAKANKRPRTFRTYQQNIKQLNTFFSEKSLHHINPFLIEQYKRKRIKDGAPVRVNRELLCLKNLYNRCKEWKLYNGDNPVSQVKFLKERRTRTIFLEPDEETRLLHAAREPIRTLILVGIYAGLRIESEALTLKWDDVNFHNNTLTVQAAYAKSGECRTIPINHLLREALMQLKEQSQSEWVFVNQQGQPYRSIHKVFQTACRHAGVSNITPHTLRHTFASRLAMAGVDLRTIQELGGWKSLRMVERYAHLSAKHKQEAVEKIATLFGQNSCSVSQRYSQHPNRHDEHEDCNSLKYKESWRSSIGRAAVL